MAGTTASDFNPFSLQVVRVVDTYGDEVLLPSAATSPSTDTMALSQRHLGDPGSPLGRMMRDLGTPTLGELSPMIPATPRLKRLAARLPRPLRVGGKVLRSLCLLRTLGERHPRLSGMASCAPRPSPAQPDLSARLYGLTREAAHPEEPGASASGTFSSSG